MTRVKLILVLVGDGSTTVRAGIHIFYHRLWIRFSVNLQTLSLN